MTAFTVASAENKLSVYVRKRGSTGTRVDDGSKLSLSEIISWWKLNLWASSAWCYYEILHLIQPHLSKRFVYIHSSFSFVSGLRRGWKLLEYAVS